MKPLLRLALRVEVLAPLVIAVIFYLLEKMPFMPEGEAAFDPRLNKWLGLIFGSAAGFAYLLALDEYLGWKDRWVNLRLGGEAMIAGAITWFMFQSGPGVFVDDAGFILRYLDHFEKGCPFCFNAAEGPVFGFSGFLFGVVTGLPVMAGVLNPDTSLFFFSYAGLFAMMWLALRLAGELMQSGVTAVPLAFFAAFCGRQFLESANSGMEMNFHIAVMLSAMLALVRNYDRVFWLLVSLSLISKLDAIPVAGLLAGLYFLRNPEVIRTLSLRDPKLRAMFLYGALPLVIWVGITMLLFGSPMPQSAFAKLYYHDHPGGHWFPFFRYFSETEGLKQLLALTMMLVPLHLGLAYAREKRIQLIEFVFGLCLAGSLALYYVYNPMEAMIWYYAFPELMLMLQFGVSLYFVVKRLWSPAAPVVVMAAIGACMLLFSRPVIKDVSWFNQYQRVVEGERLKVGHYVRDWVAEKDTLLSGHGHTARYCKGFVLDASGLNSKVPLKYSLDIPDMIKKVKPHWIVHHGFKYWVNPEIFDKQYYLDTTYWDITLYNYAPWRIWRRHKVDNRRNERLWLLSGDQIKGQDITWISSDHYSRLIFSRLDLNLSRMGTDSAVFTMAVYEKMGEFTLHVNEYAGDSLLSSGDLKVRAEESHQGCATEVRYPLAARPAGSQDRRLEIQMMTPGEKAECVDPALMFK